MKMTKEQRVSRRHLRLRQRVSGTTERPRLLARKTLRHIHVQVFDDSPLTGSVTLFAMSTASDEAFPKGGHYANCKHAAAFGKRVGDALKAKGIGKIVFDRGGFAYHGILKSLADSIRETGIDF